MLVGAPSYTSGAHMWKGAAVNLNRKPIIRNISPKAKLSERPKSKLKIFSKKELEPGWANNKCKSAKFVVPVEPYINEIPKSINPDEKAPKIKYFSPASVEKAEFFLIVVKI